MDSHQEATYMFSVLMLDQRYLYDIASVNQQGQ